MTLSQLLRNLVEAFGYTPYAKLELTWHQTLSRWSANIGYWHIQGIDTGQACTGRTPEEAVVALVSKLKGKEFHRTGMNGTWGRYTVPEEVTCDDVALNAPKERPPFAPGYNDVLGSELRPILERAERIYVRTYIGDRPIKGYPEEKMIESDRDGAGYRKILEHLSNNPDQVLEMGWYDDGKEIGLHGGLM